MLDRIQAEISKLARQSSYSERTPILVAASKTRSIDTMVALAEQGVAHFGENYVQEGVDKITRIQQLVPSVQSKLIWHMIGPVQSNKAQLIAKHFDWLHTLTSERLARRLDRLRPDSMPALNVCLQINIDAAPSKHGLSSDLADIEALLAIVDELPKLRMRGLMVMPDDDAPGRVQYWFESAYTLFNAVKARLSEQQQAYFDTLSMGMSGDYQLAVSAGSTMLRLGTALFGPRNEQS